MDVTAIFDESGNQLFSTAKILRLAAAPSNTYATHVVEDGTTVVDNKIQNQARVAISLVLDGGDYQEVYKNIQTASNENTKFTIQTRVNSFDRMYIESYPHEESADIFDTVALNIDFVEQITSTVQTSTLSKSDVANPADADTINRGEQLPKKDAGTTLQKIAGLFG